MGSLSWVFNPKTLSEDSQDGLAWPGLESSPASQEAAAAPWGVGLVAGGGEVGGRLITSALPQGPRWQQLFVFLQIELAKVCQWAATQGAWLLLLIHVDPRWRDNMVAGQSSRQTLPLGPGRGLGEEGKKGLAQARG